MPNALQLPIWSLTQERVDKLYQQMANKKQEIDDLASLSEKDLWCQDLDDFIAAWNARLADEQEAAKKVRSLGRRVSKKIGAGKNGKIQSRLKADDEYAPKVPKALKANPAKGVIKVEPPKSSAKFMSMFTGKPKPASRPENFGSDGVDEDGMSDDDFSAVAAIAPSRAPSEQPAGGRGKRAAAAKPKNWVVDDDESDSDDDKLLGDVGDMVKGIGNGSAETSAANNRLSLFQMSARGSTSGPRPTSSNGVLKAKPAKARLVDSDNDETNYEMLAKPSPHKTAPVVNNNLDSFLSNEDDDLALPVATKKAPTKAVPRPKKAPAPKKPAAPVTQPAKPVTLSPAAKAYALKQTKMKLKPQTKKAILSDDDDEDMKDPSEDESPVKPVARRPARAAAAAKPKKPVYIDSDEDDMDIDDLDESAVVEQDESEDFDDSE